MTLDRDPETSGTLPERCTNCGSKRPACPACGDHKVSVDHQDIDPDISHPPGITDTDLTPNLASFAEHASIGDTADYRLICWECGWTQDRTLTITATDGGRD